MTTSRRDFVKSGGMTLGFMVAGEILRLSPAQAYERGLQHHALSVAEVETLEALAEAIVPGAKQAGISYYLDAQLSAPTEDCLLMLKYLGVPPPFLPFYRSALQAVDQAAQGLFQRACSVLSTEQLNELVDKIASGQLGAWSGPPSGLVFFVLRSDACDVVYGTEAGFEQLGIPYMAHIVPDKPW